MQRRYVLSWRHARDWEITTEESWVSPSYGLKMPSRRIVFNRRGTLAALDVLLAPEAVGGQPLDDLLKAASI
jgi:hypothetical protein